VSAVSVTERDRTDSPGSRSPGIIVSTNTAPAAIVAADGMADLVVTPTWW